MLLKLDLFTRGVNAKSSEIDWSCYALNSRFLTTFLLIPSVLLTDDFIPCKKSEYKCLNNNYCINLDKYCNGFSDCADESDELLGCTPCNKTYYGEVGKTYELEIKRPNEEFIPFLCFLNFTATGKSFGELIQISFEAFSVGTFESFTNEGCPEGYISIKEGNRPIPSGKWCGSSWGYSVYYSETSTVNLTLHLEKLPFQQGAGYTFEFRISYKFLKATDARLRYGNSSRRTYRGKLTPGTYCDRQLDGCRKKPCKIQSPNYPGIYPRNVSCQYRIRERNTPEGMHALIVLRQSSPLHQHKDYMTKFDNSDRVFRVFEKCNLMEDYIEIFDGFEDTSPLLSHLCSGETTQEIISSGPELLVKFRTSPFGNPFHPLPLSQLPGFEMEVQIFYVKKDSPTYVEEKKCEFLITTQNKRSGFLKNPIHSLPSNTTCHYHFHGLERDIVWISFIKYHVKNERIEELECDVRLQIWDGDVKSNAKVPLIGQFCKEDKPKLCDHRLLGNKTRKMLRPCDLTESYVSTGPDLTLTQSIKYGNVLYPVQFLIKYEFVDFSQEGLQNSLNPCDRMFRKNSGRFYSPKITFLFGRGGQKSLKCSYHFESNEKRKLEITIEKLKVKNKSCFTKYNKETGRYKCNPKKGKESKTEIKIFEYPWRGIEILRDCFCENFNYPVTIQTKTARKIIVNFEITKMNVSDDFNDHFFEATYNFLPQNEGCLNPWKTKRLKGSSGEISIINRDLRNDFKENRSIFYCTQQPWLIEPENPFNNFIYLKINGQETKNVTCLTKNRILIYPVGNAENLKIICPILNGSNDVVELFSEGWDFFNYKTIRLRNSKSFVVEFIQNEPGNFIVTWMEISKNPALTLPRSLMLNQINVPNCIHSCPELEACISPDLWCDGQRHCPSGNDETEINCSINKNYNLLTIICTAIICLLICTISALFACFWKAHRRREARNVIVSVTDHTFLEFKRGLC
ncbi:uncharacterized protein [Onthophagus taurus]|uniref:uncharacterized protein isoform X1 n=1 Tax=Onthophagus taurus TaxID=166361 RepID=UPI0039BE5803